MLRSIVAQVLALGLVFGPATAMAEGNLDLMPNAKWATRLTDQEMSKLRGGLGGVSFGITFLGFIEQLGAVNGTFDVSSAGVTPADQPVFDTTTLPNGTLVSTQVGSFQGFNGVAQLAIVPGDNNFVQNNLFIQVNIMNGVATTLPSLQDMLQTRLP
jgi:hypothetical protein